jgi:tetratricopeptide (TPR) repeat protein
MSHLATSPMPEKTMTTISRTLRACCAVLVLCSTALAQVTDWAKVHSLTLSGIDQLYNLEMDEAEQTFDEVIRMAPNDPRGYFFKGMISFWVFTLNKDGKALERFFELTDRVIAISEQELSRDKNDVVPIFYLGGTYGYRGLAHQRNGSILKAAWDGRKGYSYLKDVVAKKPDLYDAHMGFGLFSYLVGKVPASYRWLLNILGFSGDVEGGLNSLRLAAEQGTYTRSEAKFFLSQFLNVEDREEEAQAHMKDLIDRYPDNTLFLVTSAQWELRSSRVDEAQELARRAVAINSRKKVRIGDEFAYGVLAHCLFLKNEFRGARTNFELYLQSVNNKETIPNSIFYRLGISHEVEGERVKAVAAYRQARKVEPQQWDYQHYRRSQIRLQHPLTDLDALLIKAENALSIKRHEAARVLFLEALNQMPDTDQLAQAWYGLMQVQYEQEQFTESIQTGRRLVALNPPRERWLVPHGLFKLGQSYAKSGMMTEARAAFQAVKRYKDYDFEARLRARVDRELQSLESAR